MSLGALDPYEVLGVRRDAGHDEIRTAYRRLARQHHPDFGGNERMMAAINDAWSAVGSSGHRGANDARHADRAARDVTRSSTPIASAVDRRSRAANDAAGPARATVLEFGRYEGAPVTDVAHTDPDYLEWLARAPAGRLYRAEINAALAPRRNASMDAATRQAAGPSQRSWRR